MQNDIMLKNINTKKGLELLTFDNDIAPIAPSEGQMSPTVLYTHRVYGERAV